MLGFARIDLHMSWLQLEKGDVQAKTSLLDHYHPVFCFTLRSASSWLRFWYFKSHQLSSWTAHHSQAAMASIGKYAHAWRVSSQKKKK